MGKKKEPLSPFPASDDRELGYQVANTALSAASAVVPGAGYAIWVAIMKDEEELPKIGGVPQSLRDKVGDAVNDLVQPKTPMPKKT
jgi:hypothetical protein